MAELSREAKQFICTHAKSDLNGEGLLDLSTLQLYTLICTEFTPTERAVIFDKLRKAFYINYLLEWKIFAFRGERALIQAEYKALCDKWEWIEAQIKAYNEAVERKEAPEFVAINLIEEAAKDFAPLVVFKGGKVQLQNRHIQREFDKLTNKHKKRLILHANVIDVIETFVADNDLADYLTDEIKENLNVLKQDLAHAPEYSRKEYLINYAFKPNNTEKAEARKRAVYPTFGDGLEASNEDEQRKIYKFLFGDLEQIEQWQKNQWAI